MNQLTAVPLVRERASGVATTLAWVGTVGVMCFVALVTALHLVDPGRDPIVVTVSEYVLGRHGSLLTFAAVGFGLGMLAIAVATVLAINLSPSIGARIGLGLWLVGALAMVIVGAFPTDPIDPTAPRFVTTSGVIHAIAGIASFTCIAIAAPLTSRRLAAATAAGWVRWLSWLPPAGYVAFWTSGLLDNEIGGFFGRISATGLGERVMAVTYIAWLLAVAAALVTRRRVWSAVE